MGLLVLSCGDTGAWATMSPAAQDEPQPWAPPAHALLPALPDASGVVALGDASAQQALNRLERAAFNDLWTHRDARSGLVYNTSEPNAPASPTAYGVLLAAIPLGIERGWIHREDGYARAQQLVRSLARAERVHGFYYHFLDPRTGRRTWTSEVSAIDSSVLFASLLALAEYFPSTALTRQANGLVDAAEWSWFLDGEDRLQWGWKPESGFDGGPMDFSESLLAYLLALGSSTHPIPADCWYALRRPISRYASGSPAMIYTSDGSLFAYLLPLAWFDLRDRHDAYADYWTNAQTAIHANIAFCRDQARRSKTYAEGLWGLSAALGPDGYQAYGAPPALHLVHDGTIAPHIIAAAIPWVPDQALSALERLEHLAPAIWTPRGFGDALNLERGYACPHTIALDQGLALLLIENMRSGLIWRLVMRHPVATRALAAAGFAPGRQPEPRAPAVTPGNPGASVVVPIMDHRVTIDADLAEWITREALELTPVRRRNVESGFFRDARDGSALVYLGWDAAHVYLAGIVTDDELVTRRRGREIYQDDCLEIFFDLDHDGFRFEGNPADVQIGLAPGGPDGAWQVWAWGALNRRPEEVQAAVTRQDGRWLFELALPRSLLPGLTVGQPVRFSVAYHDRDRSGRAAKLNWSVDTATVPGTILFGQLTLAGGPSTPAAAASTGAPGARETARRAP